MANMFPAGHACVVDTPRVVEFETAAPFIGLAIVLDMLDGRIARLTRTESAFGKEFDSLADVVSFGIAPAILAFAWGLSPLGRLGWAAGFLYVAAAAMRLARFNIQGMGTNDKRYFAGMPSPPAAGGVTAATVFAYPAGLHDYRAALLRAGDGDRPRDSDGEYHSIPQLQDDRSSGAAAVHRAHPRGGRHHADCDTPARSPARDGVYLPGLRLHRDCGHALQASERKGSCPRRPGPSDTTPSRRTIARPAEHSARHSAPVACLAVVAAALATASAGTRAGRRGRHQASTALHVTTTRQSAFRRATSSARFPPIALTTR